MAIIVTAIMMDRPIHSTKQSVEAGLGLGIVSEHTIELEKEAERLKVLNVRHFPIMRKWNVVHRKGKRLSIYAELFKKFILEKV
jgi:DNA-binding transcriptional LysR family regulator